MGSIVSGLFGSGGSGTAGKAVTRARELAPGARFNPYTVRSGTGTTGYTGDGQFFSQLSAPYQEFLGSTLGGAQQLVPQALSMATQAPSQFGGYGQGLLGQAEQMAMQQPAQFGFTPDLAGRTEEIFSQQAGLLQPEFERQATELQGRLFGSGRLGLRLAGESQGLGADSGMVSPDALGLGRAQQQTLAQLAPMARQQALGEEAQRYQQELGTFGTNVGQQQQQLANLMGLQGQGFGQAAQQFGLNTGQQQQALANIMGLQSGLFSQATGVSGLEQQLMGLGLNAEQARAAAALGAGQMELSPYATKADMEQRQQEANAGFFGDLVGAGAKAYAASDVRLKKNIKYVDTLSNGLKLYTWDWIRDDIDGPTYGVIAQEVAKIIPGAVLEHPEGYLMVNYSHPELQGVH